MDFRKITLVGVGLLGGSLGLAIKQRGLAARVEGYVRRSASIAECATMGVADHVTRELSRAVQDADLVILCTPIAQMRSLAEQMVPHLKPGVIVTDVGSVKATVVQELEPRLSRAGGQFIGSHPMAGAEKMGVAAARADLFENALCVLTPSPTSSPAALERVASFWRAIGAQILKLAPDIHDELASRASHLPHIVAAELANYVLSPVHAKEQTLLCANGFRDTTRIASGSPEMWRDIALANRKNLARVLAVFIEDLQEFRVALETEDGEAIAEFFEQAKRRRDGWCSPSHSPE
jgi:prephenate dehydrogenase